MITEVGIYWAVSNLLTRNNWRNIMEGERLVSSKIEMNYLEMLIINLNYTILSAFRQGEV